MKKFAFIFFGVFFFSVAETDARQVNSCNQSVPGNCGDGCFYDNNFCTLCDAGTYSNSNTGYKCVRCTSPEEASFITDDLEVINTGMGFADNTCPWIITCGAGEYWDKSLVLTGDLNVNYIKGCTECDIYYNINDSAAEFTVIGEGWNYDVDPKYTFENICLPKIYTLNLNKNTNLSELMVDDKANPSKIYENKTIYAKYGVGFSDNNEQGWANRLPSSAYQPSISIKQFLGYSKQRNCTNLIFSADSTVAELAWDEIGFTSDENEPVTLYACWLNTPLVVHYLHGESELEGMQQSCKIDDNAGTFQCQVKNFTGAGVTGLVFDSYKCCLDAECKSLCNKDTLKPGDDIPVPLAKTEIYLKAVFAKCPAGKYCNNGEQKNCPAGTTSAEEAEKAEDCYMPAGISGTEFCDKNGCFNLPGNEKISYFPSLS